MSVKLAWIYLFIASCLEILWVYSVKYVSKDKILHIPWRDFFHSTRPIITLVPLIGYIVFGIANIYFFSSAMNVIPASMAFAVWTGVAIVGTRMIDNFVFGQTIDVAQWFFFAMIVCGIVGLRFKSA